jgi:hypothetical protein
MEAEDDFFFYSFSTHHVVFDGELSYRGITTPLHTDGQHF